MNIRASILSPLVLGAIALVAACVGDEPDTRNQPQEDSGGPPDSDSGATVDAGDDDAKASDTCDVDAIFTEIEPVKGAVNAATGEGPTLTEDELDIFFSSSTRADAALRNEIYTAHRASTADPFDTVVRVATLSGPSQDAHPAISGDGLLVFFTSQLVDPNRLNLAYATRSQRSVDFGSPQPAGPNINSTSYDTRPFLTLDKSLLIFTSQRSGNSDIWVAKSNGLGFDVAAPLSAPINTAADESNGVLTADARTLYYVRAGKIMRAHRSAPEVPFDTSNPVDELNTSGTTNLPGWISRDGCRLYFQTNRTSQNLWIATRRK